MKQHAPSAERNRDPIAEVLAGVLPAAGLVLEVASGTGMHVVHLAARFPALTWQPTDLDPEARASVTAWTEESGLTNVRAPLALDASADTWPVTEAAAVMCINMIHIAPWAAARGLLRGAARVLAAGGGDLLYLYGPVRFDGRYTSPSNATFDASLRGRNVTWGVRDVKDLEAEAGLHGLRLVDTIAMPANNHSLIFRRR